MRNMGHRKFKSRIKTVFTHTLGEFVVDLIDSRFKRGCKGVE